MKYYLFYYNTPPTTNILFKSCNKFVFDPIKDVAIRRDVRFVETCDCASPRLPNYAITQLRKKDAQLCVSTMMLQCTVNGYKMLDVTA